MSATEYTPIVVDMQVAESDESLEMRIQNNEEDVHIKLSQGTSPSIYPDYSDIINKPKINGYELVSGENALEDIGVYSSAEVDFLLGDKANTSDVPSKISDLDNDVGYVTGPVVTSVNGLTGDVDVLAPTALSELDNDVGYITAEEVPEEIFVAEYNVTTYDEVLAAYNAGKTIRVKNVSSSNYEFVLTRYYGGETFYFYGAIMTNAYNVSLNQTNGWKIGTLTLNTEPPFNIRRQNTDSITHSILYPKHICFTNFDGKLIPANSVSNDTGSMKALTNESFNPFGIIRYYLGTYPINASEPPSSTVLYLQYYFDIRYSFNIVSLVSRKPIYIKCSPQNNGSFTLAGDDCVVQDLPTNEDGYAYIYLGMGAAQNNMSLDLYHPIYIFRNNKIQLYTGMEDEIDLIKTRLAALEASI